jgi:hypothetical protein
MDLTQEQIEQVRESVEVLDDIEKTGALIGFLLLAIEREGWEEPIQILRQARNTGLEVMSDEEQKIPFYGGVNR